MINPVTRSTPFALVRRREGKDYDEKWLQRLIDTHPALLPIAELEPTLSDARAICLELQTPSGSVDNLLITPDGGIVIVETKLWRNPQARREVVGQILDYAKDFARWSYEDLESAVRSARRDSGARLFNLAAEPGAAPASEARFVDAVSRNLRLGRFLC